MEKSEIINTLHDMAETNLFGAGSWPASGECEDAFWQLFQQHLATKVPESNQLELNKLAHEIDIHTLEAFIGVGNPSFFLTPFGWDKAGKKEYDELDEQLNHVTQRHGDELVRHYIRGAYFRYCAERGIAPFKSWPSLYLDLRSPISDTLPSSRVTKIKFAVNCKWASRACRDWRST
jgi:hypothetical protein